MLSSPQPAKGLPDRIAPDRPWGFNVAANLTGRQGYPIRYTVRVNRATISDNDSIDIPVDASPDAFRYPDLHVVSLRLGAGPPPGGF
jgi:hypothetical protein